MFILPMAVLDVPPTRGPNSVFILSGIGLAQSTSANVLRRPSFSSLSTTQGSTIEQPATEAPVSELRRRSGLTWEQLAETMGVDRRTLHLWEAGRKMRPVHEERLQQILQVVRLADRGSASATRALLLDASQGPSIKDLISLDRIQEATQRTAGLRSIEQHPRPTRLSGEAKEIRRPLPFEGRLALKNDAIQGVSPQAGRPARVSRAGKA